MPRGIPNKQPTPPVKPDDQPVSSPAPLILLQPAPEGTRIDAYGYELPEMIDEMRRALLHLVARQSGVTIISELVPRQAAVVATAGALAAPAASRPKPLASKNGTGPKPKGPFQGPRRQHDVRLADGYDDEPDLRPDLAAILDSIED